MECPLDLSRKSNSSSSTLANGSSDRCSPSPPSSRISLPNEPLSLTIAKKASRSSNNKSAGKETGNKLFLPSSHVTSHASSLPILAASSAASASRMGSHLSAIERIKGLAAHPLLASTPLSQNNNTSLSTSSECNNNNSSDGCSTTWNYAATSRQILTPPKIQTNFATNTGTGDLHGAHQLWNGKGKGGKRGGGDGGRGGNSNGHHGRQNPWQTQWINRSSEQTKDVFTCVWCKDSFKSLAEMTEHMKASPRCGMAGMQQAASAALAASSSAAASSTASSSMPNVNTATTTSASQAGATSRSLVSPSSTTSSTSSVPNPNGMAGPSHNGLLTTATSLAHINPLQAAATFEKLTPAQRTEFLQALAIKMGFAAVPTISQPAPSSSSQASGSGNNPNASPTSSGKDKDMGAGGASASALNKNSLGLPRKLVRGQDVWLGKGQEQTRQILKCMWCGQSFKSLADMTTHMRVTQHYTNIISQEQIISWRTPEDKMAQQQLNAVLTCKVCDEAFGSLKDLSNHMVKNSHYKEHILRSITESGQGRRRQTRERRKKSLPVRKLLELERLEGKGPALAIAGPSSPSSSTTASSSATSPGPKIPLITCYECNDKVEPQYYLAHLKICRNSGSSRKNEIARENESVDSQPPNKKFRSPTSPGSSVLSHQTMEGSMVDSKHSSGSLSPASGDDNSEGGCPLPTGSPSQEREEDEAEESKEKDVKSANENGTSSDGALNALERLMSIKFEGNHQMARVEGRRNSSCSSNTVPMDDRNAAPLPPNIVQPSPSDNKEKRKPYNRRRSRENRAVTPEGSMRSMRSPLASPPISPTVKNSLVTKSFSSADEDTAKSPLDPNKISPPPQTESGASSIKALERLIENSFDAKSRRGPTTGILQRLGIDEEVCPPWQHLPPGGLLSMAAGPLAGLGAGFPWMGAGMGSAGLSGLFGAINGPSSVASGYSSGRESVSPAPTQSTHTRTPPAHTPTPPTTMNVGIPLAATPALASSSSCKDEKVPIADKYSPPASPQLD